MRRRRNSRGDTRTDGLRSANTGTAISHVQNLDNKWGVIAGKWNLFKYLSFVKHFCLQSLVLLRFVAAHEKLGYRNEIIHKLLKFELLMKTGTARLLEEK